MRKLLLQFVLGVTAFSCLLCFGAAALPIPSWDDLMEKERIENLGTAKVEKHEGYYIFIMSEPTTEYEKLGTVKKGFVFNETAENMFNSIIKNLKKEYPKADAVIFRDLELKKADVIQFE